MYGVWTYYFYGKKYKHIAHVTCKYVEKREHCTQTVSVRDPIGPIIAS